MRVELEGELCVTITNDSGEISCLCSLKYLRVAPEFTSAPVESLSVYVGSSLVLGCEFTGIPVPTVKWLKDRVAISKGDVTENEAVSKLEVSQVTMADAGEYLVCIENDAGCTQFSTQVTVREHSPEAPSIEFEGSPAVILERLKDKTFAEGEDIVLRCRVEGKPSPTVKWYFEEELIWEGPPDEGGLSELILKDCWSEDMGQYRINAQNALGEDESSCKVIVQVRLKPMMDMQGPIEPMETIIEVSEHSRTTSADSHRTETQNDEVKWTEDEELNRTVDDSVLLDETKSVPLHSSTGIKSNSASQIPNFPDRSSEAFNTFIVDQEPSTEETSQDEIYDSKPEFLKIFQNADVKDGEKNFIWHMSISKASSIKVFKESEGEMEEIGLDGVDFKLRTEGNNYTLVFAEIFPDDAGLYKIVAINDLGSIEATAQLTVVPVDGFEPKMIARPKSREVKIGDTVTFSCSVEGDPTPEIEWNIGSNAFISSDSRVKITNIIEDEILDSVIEIRDLDFDDIGRSKVIARNFLAEINCPFSILLGSNDDSSQGLTDFRSVLRNKVETKTLTAEKIKESEVCQVDFRANLKKSITSENLAELVDEDTFEFKPTLTPELEEKLKRRLSKNDETSDTHYFTTDTQHFETCEDGENDQNQTSDPKQLNEIENEISMSRTSVYSIASSSSKASTVHALITETGESKDGSQSSHPEAPDALNHCQKPTIAQTLSDVVVKCSETFSLTTKIENADEVIWTLEGEEILAEPDEGLILKAEGDEYTLLVLSSMNEDMGTYNVIAKNSYGASRSHCFVSIVPSETSDS